VELQEVAVGALPIEVAAAGAPSMRSAGRDQTPAAGWRWRADPWRRPAVGAVPASDRYGCRHSAARRGALQWADTTTVRVPQQPLTQGRGMSALWGLVSNPIGEQAGIPMAPRATGLFRSRLRPGLFRSWADSCSHGRGASLRLPCSAAAGPPGLQRGSLLRVELTAKTPVLGPGGPRPVIHLFGGIGGRRQSPSLFSRDGTFRLGGGGGAQTLHGELQFALRYTIYATNSRWIRADADWSAYDGDLARGWLGTQAPYLLICWSS